MHWLAHVLGIDTQQSYFYDWWSGVATQGSLVVLAVGAFRRHNCRTPWCLRIGHYAHRNDAGVQVMLCRRHHPHTGKEVS